MVWNINRRGDEEPSLPSLLRQWVKYHWRTLLFIGALFIVSFLLRWWYINDTSMVSPIMADAALYTTIGINLAVHNAYFTESDAENMSGLITRDPGYPVFLAGIIKATNSTTFKQFFYATVFTQSILGAITVIITYFLARFFLPMLWSGVVSILTMLSPHLVSMTNYVLTETLFIFLLLLALSLYFYAIKRINSWLLVASALSFGLAMFVRSVLQLFPILLAALTLYFLWNERKNAIRFSIILLTIPFVFFVPWKIWSYSAFKGFRNMPSLLKSVFYEGSYVGVIYNDAPEGRPRYGIGMVHRDDPDFINVVNQGYGRIFAEIGKRFRKNPIKYSSWWLFGKPAMFWRWSLFHAGDINVYPSRYTWYDKNRVMNLTKKLMWLLHPVIIALMHVGAMVFIMRRKKYSRTQCIMMSTILALIVYFLFIHTILVPAPRYSLPLRPLVYFLAVFGISEFTGISVIKKTKSASQKIE